MFFRDCRTHVIQFTPFFFLKVAATAALMKKPVLLGHSLLCVVVREFNFFGNSLLSLGFFRASELYRFLSETQWSTLLHTSASQQMEHTDPLVQNPLENISMKYKIPMEQVGVLFFSCFYSNSCIFLCVSLVCLFLQSKCALWWKIKIKYLIFKTFKSISWKGEANREG